MNGFFFYQLKGYTPDRFADQPPEALRIQSVKR